MGLTGWSWSSPTLNLIVMLPPPPVQLAGVGSLASGGPQPGVGQVLLGKPPDQHHQNCTHICSVQPCWVLVGELSNDWLCVAQCIIIISNTRNTGNSNTAHKQRTINLENASISSLLFSPLLTSVTTHCTEAIRKDTSEKHYFSLVWKIFQGLIKKTIFW